MAAGQETRHPFCAAVPGARALSLNRSQTPLPFSEARQIRYRTEHVACLVTGVKEKMQARHGRDQRGGW